MNVPPLIGSTRFSLILFACVAIQLVLGSPQASAKLRYEFNEPHMGTNVVLIFYAENKHTAKIAADAAYDEIETLEKIFSNYDCDSEIRKLTASDSKAYRASTPISKQLFDVLTVAETISKQTDGAFDITVGPLIRLRDKANHIRVEMSDKEIEKARKSIGYQDVRLSMNPQGVPLVYLAKPKMRLDVAAIAKGYIADRALAVLKDAGYTMALVNAGGDIAIGESPPNALGWSIDVGYLDDEVWDWDFKIDHDLEFDEPAYTKPTLLSNCGIATSDPVRQDGAHIYDARTGKPAPNPWTAAVIAKNCMLADAYATASTVVGPPLIEQLGSDVQIRLSRVQRVSSKDFGTWKSPDPAVP